MRLQIATAAFLACAAPAAAELSVPIHGNWCGPGHGAGPALDLLDAACMRHDLCIVATGGPFNCACDLTFMDELRRGAWPNPELEDRARGVYEAITLIPCSDPDGQAMKMRWAASDWLGSVVAGRELPTAVLGRLLRTLSEGSARAHVK